MLAAVEAERLHMDRENRNDVSAVFGVEVIEVRGVLEVVGQDGAVLYNIIGDNIVAVLLDIRVMSFAARISLATARISAWGAGEAATEIV